MPAQIERKPRRRRWLRRTAWALLILVAVAAAVRVVAGIVMQSRFNGRLEALRKAGEPLTLAEMAPPEIPAERNAAAVYQQAFALIQGMTGNELRLLALGYGTKRLTPEDLDGVRALVSTGAPALQLLRRGAAMSECRFPVDYSAPACAILMPHLNGVRQGARLLVLSSRVNLADGKGEEAAKDCLDALRLGRSLESEPILISALVEAEIDDMALRQIESVMDGSEASADTLRGVWATLGDVADRSRFVRVMKGERCFGLSAIDAMLGDFGRFHAMFVGAPPGWGLRLLAFLGRPVILADAMDYLDIMDRYVDFAKRSSFDTRAERSALAGEIMTMRKTRWRYVFSATMLPSLERVFVHFDRDLARTGCAKLAVALRLHRLKSGSYPDSLDALVPEFLDKVPIDPLAGKGFIYRREGSGFIVYSVGANGKDDGGIEDPPDRDAGDIVFRCSR